MKGQNRFTIEQIDAIKKLIADKVRATPDKQKSIRAKIRNLGFYFSDFSSMKDGYTVADFENLIQSGQIIVIGGYYKPAPTTSKAETTLVTNVINPTATNISTDLNILLKTLSQNLFDPLADNENAIDNTSGNYILCLRTKSKLPTIAIAPKVTMFNGLAVIYTGIASKSLRTRDYRQHFEGNNAGRSTLRKSLGVLFGYKLIPSDKDPKTGKTKFSIKDEIELTNWMRSNLLMFTLPTAKYTNLEIKLINHFNPPLNLKNNHNSINAEFRQLLSGMRSGKG